VKLLLGEDEPAFVAAAAGAILALGIITIFHIVYFSPPPYPPLWQTIGAGIAMGLFLMPFFFMAISRTIPFMSRWAVLALMTAAGLYPLLMWHLRALEVTQFLFVVVCVAYAIAAILLARLIVIRQRRSYVVRTSKPRETSAS
jgi:hypothetical protein